MKKEIHPDYHTDAVIRCACGATLKTGSTTKEIHVDICSTCHPFYTGKQNLVDTAGIVDRFRARDSKKTNIKTGKAVKKLKTASRKKIADTKKPKA